MTDTAPPRRPGETDDEYQERLRCLASTSTRFALAHRGDDPPLPSDAIPSIPELSELTGIPVDVLGATYDSDDDAGGSVGFKYLCGGDQDDD